MASFPTTVPADPNEIEVYIRWWLGNVSTDVMSTQDMIDIINYNISKYGDEALCKITYYSTVDILNWLIRSQAASLGESSGAGALTRRREKRGKTEIEVEYSESSSGVYGWEAILDELLSKPSSIGCDPFSDSTAEKITAPIIGGADINGYEEGFRTRNKFGVAIKNNRLFGYSSYGRRLF